EGFLHVGLLLWFIGIGRNCGGADDNGGKSRAHAKSHGFPLSRYFTRVSSARVRMSNGRQRRTPSNSLHGWSRWKVLLAPNRTYNPRMRQTARTNNSISTSS